MISLSLPLCVHCAMIIYFLLGHWPSLGFCCWFLGWSHHFATILNWPQKCTRNLFIQVVICISSPTTHIMWKEELFIALSVQSRSCQDQDFNNEIKNIRYDLILNEYPQKFVDSIIKSSISNHPSSDIIYQGMFIIPYVQCISEKFRCTENCFNVRTS
jgi:hypothetical protein